jgi:hypothetical protein
LFLLQKVVETQTEKQVTKKRKIVPPFQITIFFGSLHFYNESYPLQYSFMENLMLYVAKGYWPLSLGKICGWGA